VGLAAFLVWRARWKAAAGLVITSALLLGIFVLAFGADTFGFVRASGGWAPNTYPPAQNLPGLAARWFETHQSGGALANSPIVAQSLGVGLSLVLAIATLRVCWPPGRGRVGSNLEIGLIVIAVLLTNARTWYHHYTLLAIPLAALLAAGGAPMH